MSCLSAIQKSQLRAEIAELETILAALRTGYLTLASGIKAYSLDTNEGKHSTTYTSLSEMQKAIDANQSRLDLKRRTLSGGALGSMRLRRNEGAGF